MEKRYAADLASRFKSRAELFWIDEGEAAKVLRSVSCPPSRKFYSTVPKNLQFLEDGDREYSFSIRRVIRNGNSPNSFTNTFKRGYNKLVSLIGITDSTNLTRRIRADTELMNLISQTTFPYSALGVFENSCANPELSIRTPILIIPQEKALGAQEEVLQWENLNKAYEEEKRIFGVSF